MISPLPCLDTSSACVQQLQGLAVSNSPINSKIGESIETIEEKINEATASNKQSIQLAISSQPCNIFSDKIVLLLPLDKPLDRLDKQLQRRAGKGLSTMCLAFSLVLLGWSMIYLM